MVIAKKIKCLGEYCEMPSYKLWEMDDSDPIIVKFIEGHEEIVEGTLIHFEQSLYYLIFLYLALRLQKKGILYFVERVKFEEGYSNGD